MTARSILMQGVSKEYRISSYSPAYRRLTEDIMNQLGRLVGRRSIAPDASIFRALQHVDLEVNAGERVAILGSNGAGKTTLLKILSRITEPTEGRVEILGKVGALLEVGTGFHPELTGRENVFLNGAILGMSRVDIEKRFDDIVDFAGIERFIDMPVKRYSSGMFVRLAFAVAAHLEPDVLLVDEVLSVGDLEFQEKSLGRMQEAAESGRTVLFVTHNMSAALRLCSRAILLKDGKVALDSTTPEVVDQYLASSQVEAGLHQFKPGASIEPGLIPIELKLTDDQGTPKSIVRSSEPLEVHFTFELKESFNNLRIGMLLLSRLGELLLFSLDTDGHKQSSVAARRPGTYTCRCRIPPNLLDEGRFLVGAFADIVGRGVIFEVRNALELTVHRGDGIGGQWPDPPTHCLRPALDWEYQRIR